MTAAAWPEPAPDAPLTFRASAAWLRWRFAVDEEEARRLLLGAVDAGRLVVRDAEGAPLAAAHRVAARAMHPAGVDDRSTWAVHAVEVIDPVTLTWAPVTVARVAWRDARAVAAARWRARGVPPDAATVPPAAWCSLGAALDRCAGAPEPVGRGGNDRRTIGLAALAASLGLVPLAVRPSRREPARPLVLAAAEALADAWPEAWASGNAGVDLLHGVAHVRAWEIGPGGPHPRGVRRVEDVEVAAPLLAAALRTLLSDPSRLPEGLGNGLSVAASAPPAATGGAHLPVPPPAADPGAELFFESARRRMANAQGRARSVAEAMRALEDVQAAARQERGKNLTHPQAAAQARAVLGRITEGTMRKAWEALREKGSPACNPTHPQPGHGKRKS